MIERPVQTAKEDDRLLPGGLTPGHNHHHHHAEIGIRSLDDVPTLDPDHHRVVKSPLNDADDGHTQVQGRDPRRLGGTDMMTIEADENEAHHRSTIGTKLIRDDE